jgi:hypothetical protein
MIKKYTRDASEAIDTSNGPLGQYLPILKNLEDEHKIFKNAAF